MKQFFKICIPLTAILFCNVLTITAQQDSLMQRPKIGLVLSGGGAKGMAEIGTLKLIEKYNIPIDYITGTSMGSIIGALYSMGYSAKDIEYIARDMKWTEMFSGDIRRELISIEEKGEQGKYLLEIPVVRGKPVISTGLISGQKMEMELARMTWSAHNINDFSKLPIPFACVATDIVEGKAVVLNKGYLPDALRASMSIPSVLAAVEIDGKLLVDGGITNNIPVTLAKEMGADIIICVNVQTELYKKEELNSMVKIMEQAASFVNDRFTKEEMKKADILISPNMKGFDASSFDALDSMFIIGEKAAMEKEQLFVDLSNKLKKYKYKQKPIVSPSSLYSVFINRIKYEGLNKVSKALVKSKLQLKDSSWVTLKEIENGISMLYGSNYFEKVNYRIIQDGNKTNLIIKVVEQSFSVYKVGINFNNYFNTSLLLNGTYRNILGDGSRLLLTGKIGFYPEFAVDYSIFTKWKPSIGLQVNAKYYYIEEKYYNFTDSLNLNLDNNSLEGSVGLVSSLNNSFSIGAGVKLAYKNIKSKNYKLSFEDPYRSSLSTYAYVKIDTHDENIYPNKGMFFEVFSSYIFGELNKTSSYYDKEYWKILLNYNRYIPISKKINFSPSFSAAVNFKNNIFFSERYFLGGTINYKNYIFPLEGFHFMEIMGSNIARAGASMRYEPWKGKYIFTNLNAGIAENKISDLIEPKEIYFGGSLGVGMRTIIGPIEYRISMNSYNHEVNHWIQIGYYF